MGRTRVAVVEPPPEFGFLAVDRLGGDGRDLLGELSQRRLVGLRQDNRLRRRRRLVMAGVVQHVAGALPWAWAGVGRLQRMA